MGMFKFLIFRLTLTVFILFGSLHLGFAQTGKRPIILIPGITGSQLVHSETGEIVWFKFTRPESDDDLRLPITPNIAQNKDKIVAKDILREVKLPSIIPDIQVYSAALEALKAKGYAEGDWENPQAADVFYVFAYDWRRDNVESAQQLIKKIEALKTKLGQPDLKFNVVAHSMGGLVARYAAMYGAADLPAGNGAPVPNWAGAKHFNKILLFGSPNDGSFSAFAVLIKGYTVGGRNLPFIDDLTKDDVFTLPSLYQLMPHGATARILDENLQPFRVDLYRAENWRKYGWGAISNPKFLARLKDAARIKGVEPEKDRKIKTIDDKILSETTYAQTQRFLAAVLARARQFHQALDVNVTNSPIEMFAYGSECEPTLDAVVLIRDKKKNSWRTLTEPNKIETSMGRKISEKEVKEAIYSNGDGRVPRHSLLREVKFKGKDGKEIINAAFPSASTFFFCAPHHTLLNNEAIQTNFLTQLVADVEKHVGIE